MNTLAIITKIELKKLFQRKDSWLMFTILLVPILYSVGLASNSDVITYTGAGNITAIGFASAMFQMSQSMFIFNVILSAIVGRSLASEIENKSIRLYVNRIGVRKLIYGGKELALLIFSVFIDILLVLTSIAFYYAVLIHNLADNDFSCNANGNKAENSCMRGCVYDSVHHNEFGVLYRRDKMPFAVTLYRCSFLEQLTNHVLHNTIFYLCYLCGDIVYTHWYSQD